MNLLLLISLLQDIEFYFLMTDNSKHTALYLIWINMWEFETWRVSWERSNLSSFYLQECHKEQKPNANVSIHGPLLGFTVWITTVVHKAENNFPLGQHQWYGPSERKERKRELLWHKTEHQRVGETPAQARAPGQLRAPPALRPDHLASQMCS